MIFNSFIRKHRNKPLQLSDKAIKDANYVPNGTYMHSIKFILDGLDPIKDARRLLNRYNGDQLVDDAILDAYIDADSAEEIILGERQYNNRIVIVKHIGAKVSSQVRKAVTLRKKVEEDLERILDEERQLLELKKEFCIRKKEKKK